MFSGDSSRLFFAQKCFIRNPSRSYSIVFFSTLNGVKLFYHTENVMMALIQKDSGKAVPLKSIVVISECHGKK